MRYPRFSLGKPISHCDAAPVGLINQINHKLLNFSQACDCSRSHSALTCLWELFFCRPLNLWVKARGVFAEGLGSSSLSSKGPC